MKQLILTQKLLRPISALRQTRPWHWAIALLLPFFGMVTAFGVAPNTITESVSQVSVIEEVKLPPLDTLRAESPSGKPSAQNALPEQQSYWHEERIEQGDTVASLLERLGVENRAAYDYLRTTRSARAVYHLIPGRSVSAQTTAQGDLITLRYLNGDTLLTVKQVGSSYEAIEKPAELQTQVVSSSGNISSSLFAATDEAHIPDSVAMQLVEIFSTDIDFHKDLKKNDHFSVEYEMIYDRGEAVRSGRILSAEFINQGKVHHAIWYKSSDSEGAYYNLEGKNARKAFLRSPLEFSRVTSGFTLARFHPILQSWRAHTGVDFSAPMGTRIKSTSKGVVEFMGSQAGYGNVIILRHAAGLTTLYGHMSGFAPHLQKGSSVDQGEVIGYVGMTGLATGPHVHYEFRVNGVFRDPLSVSLPVAVSLSAEQKISFLQSVAPHVQLLEKLRGLSASNFD